MKKLFLIIIFVSVLILVVFFSFFTFRFKGKEEVQERIPTPSVALPTISEDIEVLVTPRADKRAINLTIRGLKPDFTSIEYELTYLTGTGLPRGVLGKIKLAGEKEIARNDIVLGTCSSGKCAYDVGVKEVRLLLKFNHNKGESIFEKVYPL